MPGGGTVQHPPEAGLDMSSSTVYKVCMTQRAVQEATFLILTALAAGSQRGYGIITDVQQISGGRVRLQAAALDRLRADELIGVDGKRSSRAGCAGTTGSPPRARSCGPTPRPRCRGWTWREARYEDRKSVV